MTERRNGLPNHVRLNSRLKCPKERRDLPHMIQKAASQSLEEPQTLQTIFTPRPWFGLKSQA